MAERDRFELDLAAALRDYAVDAPTEVRPAELAHHFADTYPHGRSVTGRWSFGLSPALAWVLLLIGLLVALVAGTLAVGSRLLESREPLLEQEPGLLEGMVAEEVEPGVFRVVNDGVRDLASVEAADIVAGYDGGIWLLREDGFLRLGSDGSHAWPADVRPEDVFPGDDVFEVAPDGTMWVSPNFFTGPALRSTDGEEWTVQPCPDGAMDCGGFTVAPDGTLWTSWEVEPRWRVSHLGPTGWQSLDKDTVGELRPLLPPTDAGDLYAVGSDDDWYLDLWRYKDGVWRELGSGLNVDVGPDGTVWARVGAGVGDPALPDEQAGLARLAGGEWELWASADILPDIRIGGGSFVDAFEVAPDGGLWVSLWRGITGYACDGLARFDGVALDRFLPGRCLLMDIAADGSVWVVAADDAAVVPEEGRFPDDQTWGLYVITPEAVSR
jgi:hypothetical protein